MFSLSIVHSIIKEVYSGKASWDRRSNLNTEAGMVASVLFSVCSMPNTQSQVKEHDRLEWWRRVGFDAFQDPDDDTIKWQPLIVCTLLQLATLAVFLVLGFDVLPGGASTAWVTFGPYKSPEICEYENPAKMVRQLSTALSGIGYCFVGLWIGMFAVVDFLLVAARRRDRVPYSKGPKGNMHVKVKWKVCQCGSRVSGRR